MGILLTKDNKNDSGGLISSASAASVPSYTPVSANPTRKQMPMPENKMAGANNAAMDTFKKFTGGVANKVGSALAYPGQVIAGTFNQLATGVQNLPENIKKYDSNYGDRVRADLAASNNNQIPTPFNSLTEQQSDSDPAPQLIPHPPMRSEPMPIPSLGTNSPGYVSKEQIARLREEKANPVIMQSNDTQKNNDFNDSNLGQQYDNLNNRGSNNTAFQRNYNDAENQDAASKNMIDRINRGTEAMAEVRRLKEGPGAKFASTNLGNITDSIQRPVNTTMELINSVAPQHRNKLIRQAVANEASNYRANNTGRIANQANETNNKRIDSDIELRRTNNERLNAKNENANKQLAFNNGMRQKEYTQKDRIAKDKLSGKKVTAKDKWDNMFSDSNLMSAFEQINPGDKEAIDAFNKNSEYPYDEVLRFSNQFSK